MNLNKDTYKMLEYTGDGKYRSAVGRIITQDGKVCTAEIGDDIITDLDELNQIRAFLDIAEEMMTEANPDE